MSVTNEEILSIAKKVAYKLVPPPLNLDVRVDQNLVIKIGCEDVQPHKVTSIERVFSTDLTTTSKYPEAEIEIAIEYMLDTILETTRGKWYQELVEMGFRSSSDRKEILFKTIRATDSDNSATICFLLNRTFELRLPCNVVIGLAFKYPKEVAAFIQHIKYIHRTWENAMP